MELESRRRRRNYRKAVRVQDGRSIHDVPDDLLRFILLRLDSPIWVMRAACACRRWRRIVNDGDEGRAFLRLASSLHPPTVVGQYHNKINSNSLFVPAASSPIDDGGRFSVSLPVKSSPWHVADCHGGLILLRLCFAMPTMPLYRVSKLIVYDPLTRQHRQIPRVPPPPNKQVYIYDYDTKDTFLLDGDDGSISISNFRVLYRLETLATRKHPQACVLSTANGGEWHWQFLSRPADKDIFYHLDGHVVGRADGSLYLGLTRDCGVFVNKIVTLDNTSLVFSKVDLPIRLLDTASFDRSTFTLVVHGPGGLGPSSPPRTSIVHVRGEELELFRQVHGSSSKWVREQSIHNLSAATRGLSICLEKEEMVKWMTTVGLIADGSAIVILSANSYINRHRWFFSFDVNTMELQVLPQELYRDTWQIFNYTLPWPQFLRACPCS